MVIFLERSKLDESTSDADKGKTKRKSRESVDKSKDQLKSELGDGKETERRKSKVSNIVL